MIDPRLPPFVLTGGRVRAATELPLETPVSSTPTWTPPATVTPEHQLIVGRCAQPQTIVDLSSALGAPVGVVRVLVLDLAEQGALEIHRRHGTDPTAVELAPHRDVALLEETLRGIANL